MNKPQKPDTPQNIKPSRNQPGVIRPPRESQIKTYKPPRQGKPLNIKPPRKNDK